MIKYSASNSHPILLLCDLRIYVDTTEISRDEHLNKIGSYPNKGSSVENSFSKSMHYVVMFIKMLFTI